MKFLAGQAAGSQSGDQRTGAGNGLDPETRRHGIGHHPFPRITDSGTAGIGDQGHLLAPAETVEDLGRPTGFVETKVADHRLAESEMGQQLAGVSRVLGDDDVALLQHTQGAQGDVLQVPDRGGDQIQGPRDERREVGGRSRPVFHADRLGRVFKIETA